MVCVERISTALIERSLFGKILGLKLVVELIELVWVDAGNGSVAIGNKLKWERSTRQMNRRCFAASIWEMGNGLDHQVTVNEEVCEN